MKSVVEGSRKGVCDTCCSRSPKRSIFALIYRSLQMSVCQTTHETLLNFPLNSFLHDLFHTLPPDCENQPMRNASACSAITSYL